MKNDPDKKYIIQQENLSSLARRYKMDVRTFKKNISAISHKLKYKKERRRTLSKREVGYIVEHLGEPEIVD